jgi:hypothetical protein
MAKIEFGSVPEQNAAMFFNSGKTMWLMLSRNIKTCRDDVILLGCRDLCPIQRQSELGDLADDMMIAFTEQPNDRLILVAGGSGASAHNLCLPSFGNTRAVTVAL